jgi:hypothetical protein
MKQRITDMPGPEEFRSRAEVTKAALLFPDRELKPLGPTEMGTLGNYICSLSSTGLPEGLRSQEAWANICGCLLEISFFKKIFFSSTEV